jgi:hypothetical protein
MPIAVPLETKALVDIAAVYKNRSASMRVWLLESGGTGKPANARTMMPHSLFLDALILSLLSEIATDRLLGFHPATSQI